MAAATVDLQIEKRGGQPLGFVIGRGASSRLDGFDEAVGAYEIDDLARGIMTAPKCLAWSGITLTTR